MKTNSSNFLQFNNTNIVFTDVNGVTYVAIKPICIALNVDYSAQLKRLKKHPILAPEYAILPIQVGDFQGRDYTCIPEKFVYGWIFAMTSNSEGLIEYQKECYNLLYNHFHGIIGKRKELLLGVAETQLKITDLKKDLENNKTYKELIELENNKKLLTSEMKRIDNIVVNQTEINFN
jgi:hypothetical protein